jgi:nitrate/nitrite-specific signal transduction histidine kinase
MSSARGHWVSTGSDPVPRNYSYTKVGNYGWSVLVGLPEREVLSGAWSNVTTSLWLVLSVMIVVLGMVWIIGQRIRRPINALARSSQSIVEQRSSEPLRLSGPREVALAADSFNRMLEVRLLVHTLQDSFPAAAAAVAESVARAA